MHSIEIDDILAGYYNTIKSGDVNPGFMGEETIDRVSEMDEVHQNLSVPVQLVLPIPHTFTDKMEATVGPPAVLIDSGFKKYGTFPVLTNLNIHIKEHTIYGLLGSSGCGKTTVLSCIVGLRYLDAGEIFICGEKPGSKESGVPGKRVGYMPQEVALNSEFTIREVMQYFGRIYGMTMDEVDVRREYLVSLLQLSTCKGKLSDMSGGQKRRVSFAVALLHEPELLILDEPTVGVDPLLRQSIWQHLSDLAAENRTTVIITTHYIEETRQADTIGLMRNGRLVVEDSPATLLETFNCSLLEDIVLKLCLRDEDVVNAEDAKLAKPKRRDSLHNTILRRVSTANARVVPAPEGVKVKGVVGLRFGPVSASTPSRIKQDYSTRCFDRLRALALKNILVMLRSVGFLLFLFVVPAVQIVMVCVCLGSDPKYLKFGIVNHEVPRAGDCWYEDDLCILANLSCRYIGAMDKKMITQIPYETEAQAIQDIVNGRLWGYVSFPQNFSDNMIDRVGGGKKANLNSTIVGSQIRFKMDMSNTQIALSLQKEFFDSFRKFLNTLMTACGNNVEGKDIPLVFEEPVYGSNEITLTDFITPGIAMAFISFMSSLTCGLAFIVEKKDGMLHRAMVAGVLKLEIMLAHSATHFLVLVVQTTIVFLVMFFVFDIPGLGSLPLAYVLVLFNGMAGMALGFVAATVCNEEKNAMLLAIGAILPCFLVSGSIFPFESLPVAVQYVGLLVPGTLPSDALRSILLRGWGLNHFSVWIGFVSAIIWTCVYWTITFTAHKLIK